MGRPRPWGREGGPGWLFSTAPLPPLSSHSLSSLPSLRRAPSRTRTRPAPLPSPPPKTPLKATVSRAPPRAPSPEMRRAPPGQRSREAPGAGVGPLSPRVTPRRPCALGGGVAGARAWGPARGRSACPPPGRGRFAKCKEGAQKVALGCSPGCLRGVKVYHSSSMESKGMEKPCTVGVPRGPTSRPTAPHLSSPTPSPSSAVRIGVRAPGTTAQPALQWPTERQTGRGGCEPATGPSTVDIFSPNTSLFLFAFPSWCSGLRPNTSAGPACSQGTERQRGALPCLPLSGVGVSCRASHQQSIPWIAPPVPARPGSAHIPSHCNQGQCRLHMGKLRHGAAVRPQEFSPSSVGRIPTVSAF